MGVLVKEPLETELDTDWALKLSGCLNESVSNLNSLILT